MTHINANLWFWSQIRYHLSAGLDKFYGFCSELYTGKNREERAMSSSKEKSTRDRTCGAGPLRERLDTHPFQYVFHILILEPFARLHTQFNQL